MGTRIDRVEQEGERFTRENKTHKAFKKKTVKMKDRDTESGMNGGSD